MSEQQPGRPSDEAEVGAVSASQADVPVAEPVTEADPLVEPMAGAEPTPVVGAADATFEQPAGTAQPAGSLHAAPTPIGEERPEVLVGAAFGGGLVAAMFLKSLARRKHR